MKEGIVKKIVTRIPVFVLKIFFIARKFVFNYFNKKVDTYIALAHASRKRLIEYGIPADRVRVVYHYFLSPLKETSEQIDPVSAIFIGWLSVENGTNVLVDAFIRVLQDMPQAKLYLIGTGKEPFVAGLRTKVAENNAQKSIIFLGKKENAEALSILKKCGVVVVPHQWPKEFGPVVLIEATALDKPVITGKIGATDEFVSDTVNGFLVEDYKNPAAFAEKIKYLLSNPQIAREMGKKGRDKVGFVFDNSSAEELMGVYKGLIGVVREY
jgi:glycosyltransferase involved in cell wall biosynthesis